jgi:hypothetical protein
VTVLVADLTWHRPSNAESLMAMLQLGNERRTQHPTDANAESSRSHAVFQVQHNILFINYNINIVFHILTNLNSNKTLKTLIKYYTAFF